MSLPGHVVYQCQTTKVFAVVQRFHNAFGICFHVDRALHNHVPRFSFVPLPEHYTMLLYETKTARKNNNGKARRYDGMVKDLRRRGIPSNTADSHIAVYTFRVYGSRE